jgi:hypothetical protein
MTYEKDDVEKVISRTLKYDEKVYNTSRGNSINKYVQVLQNCIDSSPDAKFAVKKYVPLTLGNLDLDIEQNNSTLETTKKFIAYADSIL